MDMVIVVVRAAQSPGSAAGGARPVRVAHVQRGHGVHVSTQRSYRWLQLVNGSTEVCLIHTLRKLILLHSSAPECSSV